MLACLGCGTPCESERALAPSGAIRHARFVGPDTYLEVASNAAGQLVRANCDGDLLRYDAGLAPRDAIDIEYQLDDEQSVDALVLADDGTLAVLSFELEYIGDIDAKSFTRLDVYDPSGERRWRAVLSTNEITHDYDLQIGPAQVYVAIPNRVIASDRDTGAFLWTQTTDGVAAASIAADPSGVVVATRTQLVAYDTRGAMRWSREPAMLGLAEYDRVATATDGSIAVLGNDGALADGSAQAIAMLDAEGALRWSVPLGERFADRVTSLVTDGDQIVAAGDYGGALGFAPDAPVSPDADGFVATVDAAGVRSVTTTTGAGTQRLYLTSLTADTVLGYATSFDDPTAPHLGLGDLAVDGNGIALLELAR